MVRTGETELEKAGGRQNILVRPDETTGNRQTENTGINTLGIMGDTCKGVETSTKIGETDGGVTNITEYHFIFLSMVVAASCYGYACHRQGLGSFLG
jgi:hypothetical protein